VLNKHYYTAYLTEEDRKRIVKELFDDIINAINKAKELEKSK